MGLFSPKRKKVLVAEEHTGPMDRRVYDYRDMDVHVSEHEREVDGQEVPVRDYSQRRRVRTEGKAHWYSLKRKKEPEPTFLEKAGDAAGEQADFMEK